MAKKKTNQVRLTSKETSYIYVTTKTGEKKLELMKFCPILRKHVLFKEKSMK